MTNRSRLWIAAAVLSIGLGVALIVHDVPTGVTADDRRYAGLILSEAGYSAGFAEGAKPDDFEGEVRAVVAVQDAVLSVAGRDLAIPTGREREPKDLYELKHGLCFDRSRAIEKILTWIGFETRHVSVYATNKASWLVALATPRSPSHAVSEVLTQKGWMALDSNRRWIGLDADREVVSVAGLRSAASMDRLWAKDSRAPLDKIFTRPFVAVRGLYSRHGAFYPPYTPVPDYNLRQLFGNVLD
jgi:hypothetical protein